MTNYCFFSGSIDMSEVQMLELFCETAASLFHRGYATGSSGNMSLRLPDGDIILTPTGSSLGKLEIEKLSRLRPDGTLVSGDKPTKEAPLHLAFYAQQTNCGAVVHLHSPYATAYSCLKDLDPENALPACTPYLTMKAGKLLLVPYFKPGSPALFEAAGKLAGTAKALLLANHGQVAVGKNLASATALAEEIEASTQLHFILQGSGVRFLTEAETAELMPR